MLVGCIELLCCLKDLSSSFWKHENVDFLVSMIERVQRWGVPYKISLLGKSKAIYILLLNSWEWNILHMQNIFQKNILHASSFFD